MELRRKPTHPGLIIKEVIFNYQSNKSEFAQKLRLSRQTLHRIIKEQDPISPTTAIKLETLLGIKSEFWLILQLRNTVWNVKESQKESFFNIFPYQGEQGGK